APHACLSMPSGLTFIMHRQLRLLNLDSPIQAHALTHPALPTRRCIDAPRPYVAILGAACSLMHLPAGPAGPADPGDPAEPAEPAGRAGGRARGPTLALLICQRGSHYAAPGRPPPPHGSPSPASMKCIDACQPSRAP